jgi:tyrosine-specific transport protein
MSTLSAALLIAGTTVGAGILALPSATFATGFVPSTVVLVAAWLFMALNGLLIAETTVNVICETRKPGLGLLVTAEQLLGKPAGLAAAGAYAFIHYALLVAYIAQGGDLLRGTAQVLLVGGRGGGGGGVRGGGGVGGGGGEVPLAAGGICFVGLFGSLLTFGSEALVSMVNNVFVGVVVASFAAIVALGAPQVSMARLCRQDWSLAPATAPICILSLVYHNIIPVLCSSLSGDMQKIKTAIVAGSALPLVMFVAWNFLVIGAVGPKAFAAAASDPLAALRAGAAGAGTQGRALGLAVAVFSEFAIITSFLGFFYGTRQFLTDMLKIDLSFSSSSTSSNTTTTTSSTSSMNQLTKTPLRAAVTPTSLTLAAAVLLPPLVVATVKPGAFLGALNLAGSFGVTTLFAVIPAAMAWMQRYRRNGSGHSSGPGCRGTCPAVAPSTPFGRVLLMGVLFVSLCIIADGARFFLRHL